MRARWDRHRLEAGRVLRKPPWSLDTRKDASSLACGSGRGNGRRDENLKSLLKGQKLHNVGNSWEGGYT